MFCWKEREYLNRCGVGGLNGKCRNMRFDNRGDFEREILYWSVGVVELVEDDFFSTQGPDASHILQETKPSP